jgi:hypothetical protein
MADKRDATVQVLTAEVRVLQVGSRQVTLSVVRQLDWAEPASVQPLGRVRTGDKSLPRQPRTYRSYPSPPASQHVEVVASADGSLVRSVAWRTVLKCSSEERCACPEMLLIQTAMNSRSPAPERDALVDQFSRHIGHEWTRYDPDKRTYQAWEHLPLIVLAGLR